MQTLKILITITLLLNLAACGGTSLEEISATEEKLNSPAPETPTKESSTTQASLGSMGGTSYSDNFILESKGITEETASGQNYTLENE